MPNLHEGHLSISCQFMRTGICATYTYFKNWSAKIDHHRPKNSNWRAARTAQCRAKFVKCSHVLHIAHLGKTAASTETILPDHSVKQANFTSFPWQTVCLRPGTKRIQETQAVLSSKALSPRLVWSWPLIWLRISTSWESFGRRAQSFWSQSIIKQYKAYRSWKGISEFLKHKHLRSPR